MAVIESNQMRRAHRVNIPLTIVIENKAYHSKDWSMTGAGVENLDREFQKDEIVKAAIIIALQEAKIEIPVKMQFKVQRGSTSGFEFVDISEKNRRVLREFLELSIEGKLDSIDGLVSVYNEPVVDTPIKESVVLSDEEESVLKKAFDKRAKLYIKLGILFLITLILTIYYNTAFVYRSIGTVSGNFVKISPSISGKLSKFYVNMGDKVAPKDLLFELDDTMVLNQIDILDAKLVDLKGYRGGTTRSRVSYGNRTVLKILKNDMNKSYASYISAQRLYKKRLIPIRDLQHVEDIYTRNKVKYLQEKDKFRRVTTTTSSSSSMISLITQFELRRAELINKLNYLRIFSETSGHIYAMKFHTGNYVSGSDEVIVIETDESSFVVCKLKQAEVLKIKAGMPVKIYSNSHDKTYPAKIESIGNLSLNTESQITNEVSLKEVTVKIVFDDKNLRLPLNERVKVWFYRPLF